MPGRSLSRRTFLRGAGVALALPSLDAMWPALARSQETQAALSPRRMIAIHTNMGILPMYFFPEEKGHQYKASPYLQILEAHRSRMTIFSGVSHPEVDGGHQAEQAFLTAAPHPGSGSFKNSISLDVYAAEHLGPVTRFPILPTRIGHEMGSLSYTRSGVQIPAERSVSAIYRKLFVQGSPQETQARIRDLRNGRSILDFVHDGAKDLQHRLGPSDRSRLEQFFTSVRDLETQMFKAEEWETRPKPRVEQPEPQDAGNGEFAKAHKLLYDIIRLAIETDSTRLVTVFINTLGVATDIPGVSHETHSLTHHGNRPEVLAELRRIEEMQFRALRDLLDGLARTPETEQSLLDRTMVLYGTCMGSANSHSNTNLPVLLVGGGFKHAGHLVFDTQRNYPLPNLFLSMLHRLGIPADRFASSTGTMRGLELA